VLLRSDGAFRERLEALGVRVKLARNARVWDVSKNALRHARSLRPRAADDDQTAVQTRRRQGHRLFTRIHASACHAHWTHNRIMLLAIQCVLQALRYIACCKTKRAALHHARRRVRFEA